MLVYLIDTDTKLEPDVFLEEIVLLEEEYVAGELQSIIIAKSSNFDQCDIVAKLCRELSRPVAFSIITGNIKPELYADFIPATLGLEAYKLCRYKEKLEVNLIDRNVDAGILNLVSQFRDASVFTFTRRNSEKYDIDENYTSIHNLIEHVLAQYEKYSKVLKKIFYNTNFYSFKTLESSYSNSDIDNLKLNEITMFFDVVRRLSIELRISSPNLSDNLIRLSNLDVATKDAAKNVELFNNGKDCDIARPSIYLSVFFMIYSDIFKRQGLSILQYMFCFRSLEVFVDAILLQQKVMTVGYLGRKQKYLIRNSKVEGFGIKWREIENLSTKNNFNSKYNEIKRLVEIRNSLMPIHGVSSVNAGTSNEFREKLFSFFELTQDIFWPKSKIWSSTYVEFDQKINFNFYDPVIQDSLEAIGLDIIH